MPDDDSCLICSACGWFGPSDDAMPAEGDAGEETMFFCPECAEAVFEAS